MDNFLSIKNRAQFYPNSRIDEIYDCCTVVDETYLFISSADGHIVIKRLVFHERLFKNVIDCFPTAGYRDASDENNM